MKKKYTTLLDGAEMEVGIERKGPYCFCVSVDGSEYEADARICGADQVSLLVGHRSYDISFSHNGDLVELQFRNQCFAVEVLDERKMRMRQVRPELESSGCEVIVASMPGKVVKVLVEEGESVGAGGDVVILEAMKMEMKIKSRHGGVVRSVSVTAGQTVESKTELLIIEAGSE